MGLRFDATTDALNRTASAPSQMDYLTVTCWSKLKVDQNQVSCMWSINNASNEKIELKTESNGTTARLQVQGTNGGLVAFVVTGPSMSLDTWYFFACKIEKEASNVTGYFYWANAGDATLSSANAAGTQTRAAPDKVSIGLDYFGTRYWDGELAAVKIFDDDLSLARIEQEMNMMRPMFTGNLWACYPLLSNDGSMLVDWSGNARDLTTPTSTPAAADQPPIQWGPKSKHEFIFDGYDGSGYAIEIGDGSTIFTDPEEGPNLALSPIVNQRPNRVLLNKNLTALNLEDTESTIRSLINHMNDAYRAIEDIYNRLGFGADILVFGASEFDEDGLPSHGSVNSLINGQYLRVVSPGAGVNVAVSHGLGRIPQGSIVVYQEDTVPSIPGLKQPELAHLSLPGATNSVMFYHISALANRLSIFLIY